ncbi:hypothetical protein GGI19_004888 [Coemansia pectinata]|uniref:Transmembrane protein n=1 Tax=Coemansia pectinata TaxID=1052879 RepID=A0A9W8LA49_9FUNG|nr:hypothetical protein GGI19_004888 [Coemansia pectinata]
MFQRKGAVVRALLSVRDCRRCARPVWRSIRQQHTEAAGSSVGKTSGGGLSEKQQVIFEAPPGNAVRMLKFMSLAGTAIGCTATAASVVVQAQGQLGEFDLSVVSLVLASSISAVSTILVTKAFGPFITRITLLPPTAGAKGIRINKHGLPKFDSILSMAPNSAGSLPAARPMLSGMITHDTEIVLQSPGLLGFNSHFTRLKISDLEPSTRRFRTWELTEDALEQRKRLGLKTPIKTFTILWRSLRNSPNKKLMEEIDSLVGAK